MHFRPKASAMAYDSPMGSRKGQARAKKSAQFCADSGISAGRLDNLFAAEGRRASDAFNERQRQACLAKNRYDTREDAEEAARTCTTSGRRKLSVYRCDYCDGWHLTSHPWD